MQTRIYSTLRTALLIPSITRRIDDLLLVKEVNAKLFDQEISEDLLHMALCTPSSGVEYDYERLELLGELTFIGLGLSLIGVHLYDRRCLLEVPHNSLCVCRISNMD